MNIVLDDYKSVTLSMLDGKNTIRLHPGEDGWSVEIPGLTVPPHLWGGEGEMEFHLLFIDFHYVHYPQNDPRLYDRPQLVLQARETDDMLARVRYYDKDTRIEGEYGVSVVPESESEPAYMVYEKEGE